ncbi:MAG: alpha/beta hydrolase [Rhizobiales bacterium]|nr:alpha/beta hydrolase [Hyphomicrobiales bacterium]
MAFLELVSTPENPVPEGAVVASVKTQDGVSLRAMRLVRGRSRGTVVILGGRGDFLERYFETARDLVQRGYSVAALDVRGQGGSDRLLRNAMRGHVRSFEQHDEDLRAFMTQVVLPDCPPPYYAIGHSTGGLVLFRALQSRTWFSRAVAVAPLFEVQYGAWPRSVARVLTALAVAFGFGGMFLPGQKKGPLGRNDFDGNPLTLDRERWNRDSAVLEAEPRLGTGAPTFAWLDASFKAFRKLKRMRRGTALRCPLLIVAAGLERVVDNEAIREIAGKVSGVSLVFVRESLHEVLTERSEVREQFLAAFDAFVPGPK